MALKQMIAVFGVLAFLGTFVALAATAFALVVARVIGERRLSDWVGTASEWLFARGGLARKIPLAAGVLVLGYSAVLVTASAMSRDWTIAPGEEKYFCEIDCHLAYSVTGVDRTKTIQTVPNQTASTGVFYILTVRTRFDERTISPHRGNGPLTPSPRVVMLLDEQGRSYSISSEGQQAMELSLGDRWTPLVEPLRPGESYATPLVFDLPASARPAKLLIRTAVEPAWLGRLLIGDEGSLFHKKVYLRVPS
jgi:hypothetical protein